MFYVGIKETHRKTPRFFRGHRIVSRSLIAEKPMVCIGDLDVDIRFAGSFHSVNHRANLILLDVLVHAAPEKQHGCVKMSGARQQCWGNAPSVKRKRTADGDD